MSVGWTYDSTSPITNSYVACNVGNNPNANYCATGQFNLEQIAIGPGQRLVPGKYTLYISMKDVTTASNSETIILYSNCAGYSQTYNIPITNAWPVGLAHFFSVPVDFSSLAGSSSCSLGVRFEGATTADQVQVGFFDFAPVAESLNAQTINATTINLPGGSTGSTPTGCAQSPVTGINGGYTCPTRGNQTTLTANQGSSDSTITVTTTSGFSAAGCFFVDGEYECYSSIANGTTFAGITRGAYLTAATTHNSGATVVGVSLVLGSVQQPPSTVIAYGSSEAQIVSVNNGFPYNYGGAAVFEINNGGNTLWVDTSGAIHQLNTGVTNNLQGSLLVGSALANQPGIAQTGYLLQTNGMNTAYQPLTLGGGHAGSLNVITTPAIGIPSYLNGNTTGSSTTSYVCAGTDFDGNLIPGTTLTLTNTPATWSFPQGYTVVCPWAAGVNTYQVYRTAGGGSQGLLGSGTGPGFAFNDFGGAATPGSPPASNSSNPHISVAGTGNPTITMGTVEILNGAGAPSGCGTTYGNGSIYSRIDGTHAGTTLLYVCDAATTTWVAFE